MTHITRVTGIIALGLTLLSAGPAIAQNSQSSQVPAAPQTAQNFSQKQLQSFAEATAKINSIRKSALQSVQDADGRKAKARIRKQSRKQMLAAIQDSGLTVQEYNQIARAAQANPQLAAKIKQMQ